MSRKKTQRPESKFAVTLKVTSTVWLPIPGAESLEGALASVEGLKHSGLLQLVEPESDLHDYDIEVEGVHRV